MGLLDKDGARHGTISREAFVQSVGAPIEEELAEDPELDDEEEDKPKSD
jgi:hypothetical protein